MRKTEMKRVKVALRLRFENQLNQSNASRTSGIPRSTLQDCWQRFDRSGLSWSEAKEMTETALEIRLYPTHNSITKERPIPDWQYVHQELKRTGVTLTLLWEEYIDQNPDGIRYSAYCERYKIWKKGLKVWMRQTHKAGEKVFVDYSGKRPEIVNKLTGEVRKVELFIMSWGASDYIYAEAHETQRLADWTMGHVRAFEYFGCSPKLTVPDCLKSAVTKSNRYDPVINLSYAEMAAHYGIGVLPARPRKPKDKGKVENNVLIIQRWILARIRNTIFFSLEELNKQIHVLLEEVNNRKIKKYNQTRLELFNSIDKPAANPLPVERFEYREWKKASVGIDYHVEIDKHYYSVPFNLYGNKLDVCVKSGTIEIHHKGDRICTHERSLLSFQSTTLPEHMPSSHQKHVEWTPKRILMWAAQTGPNTKSLVEEIIKSKPHPEIGFRPALGITRLAKTFSEEELELASGYALEHGLKQVSQVKNVLKKKLYLTQEQGAGITVIPCANVRGKEYYQ